MNGRMFTGMHVCCCTRKAEEGGMREDMHGRQAAGKTDHCTVQVKGTHPNTGMVRDKSESAGVCQGAQCSQRGTRHSSIKRK